MQDEEIRQKVASFPRWHYQFDLRGNLTPIHKKPRVNRHTQRKKHFFDPIVRLFGGSLEGKRILDLASNAGYWSLASIEAGADYVLGIEGRQMHVDQASFVFEVKEVESDRYDFALRLRCGRHLRYGFSTIRNFRCGAVPGAHVPHQQAHRANGEDLRSERRHTRC